MQHRIAMTGLSSGLISSMLKCSTWVLGPMCSFEENNDNVNTHVYSYWLRGHCLYCLDCDANVSSGIGWGGGYLVARDVLKSILVTHYIR